MCVCVFWIHVLKIAVEWWFWEVNMVFESLVELHAWLHSYLCFSLLEKQFLSNLDTSSTPGYLSRFFSFSLSQSWYLLDNFSIHRESFCLLDSFSITVRSIEVCSIAARHLSISRDPLACIVFHTQHDIFFAILDTCADTMWFGHHKFYMR